MNFLDYINLADKICSNYSNIHSEEDFGISNKLVFKFIHDGGYSDIVLNKKYLKFQNSSYYDLIALFNSLETFNSSDIIAAQKSIKYDDTTINLHRKLIMMDTNYVENTIDLNSITKIIPVILRMIYNNDSETIDNIIIATIKIIKLTHNNNYMFIGCCILCLYIWQIIKNNLIDIKLIISYLKDGFTNIIDNVNFQNDFNNIRLKFVRQFNDYLEIKESKNSIYPNYRNKFYANFNDNIVFLGLIMVYDIINECGDNLEQIIYYSCLQYKNNHYCGIISILIYFLKNKK